MLFESCESSNFRLGSLESAPRVPKVTKRIATRATLIMLFNWQISKVASHHMGEEDLLHPGQEEVKVVLVFVK
jgi:hypothetical protein